MSNLEYIELYPKIDIYRNVLSNPQKLYETMKKSEQNSEGKHYLNKWDPWANFGTYTQIKDSSEINNSNEDLMFIEEEDFAQQIQSAYDLVLNDYINRHNVELKPDWHFSGCSFSKYNDQVDLLNNEI